MVALPVLERDFFLLKLFLRRPGVKASFLVKILVFAHKPPPHHGQSYMVQLLVDALGGDVRTLSQRGPSSRIECYHLDARYSADTDDVGQARFSKVLLALKYSLQAVWCRFRHGVRHLYYVPAFPARTPVYRD